MKNALKALADNNIPINWGTLLVGWRGLKTFFPQISAPDVIQFAIQKLETEASVPEQVLRLASLYETDTHEVGSLLFSLSKSVPYDHDIEERKWRLVMLIDLLQHLPDDPMNGTLELVDFWSSWGFPKGSPISEININKYSDRQSFEKLRADLELWINREKNIVRINRV